MPSVSHQSQRRAIEKMIGLAAGIRIPMRFYQRRWIDDHHVIARITVRLKAN